MKKLIENVTKRLRQDSRLSYIQKGGGILVISSIDQFPAQFKTPLIVLTDGSTPEVRHLSGGVRERSMRLQVRSVQRIFERQDIIKSSPFDKGVEEISEDVRQVLDLHRFDLTYTKAFLQSEDAPTTLTISNQHLIEKVLTFEYVRIEC